MENKNVIRTLFVGFIIAVPISIAVGIYYSSSGTPTTPPQVTSLPPGTLTPLELSARQVLLAEQRKEIAQVVPITSNEMSDRATLLAAQRKGSVK
jgi:hypothetical protein